MPVAIAPLGLKSVSSKGGDLNDKNIEAIDVLGPDYKSYDWQRPDTRVAAKERKQNLLLYGVHPLCNGRTDDPLLGTATIFYFNFIKQMMILFALMTLLASPAIYFASTGRKLAETGFANNLAVTSIGNMGVDPNDSDSTDSFPLAPGVPTEIDPFVLSYIVTGCAGVSVLFVFIFIGRITSRLNSEAKRIDENTVTVADYTVFVRGLPTDATHDEILEHFNNLYRLDDTSWSDRGWCCGLLARHKPHDPADIVDRGYIVSPRVSVTAPKPPESDGPKDNPVLSPRVIVKESIVRTPRQNNALLKGWKEEDFKMAESLSPKKNDKFVEAKLIQMTQPLAPIRDISNSGNKIYKGKYVAEVQVAHPNGLKIRQYLKIIRLTTELRHARVAYQRAKHYKSRTMLIEAELRLEKLQQAFNRRIKKYESLGLNDTDSLCEAAFVVFDHEESYIRCLQDYGRYYNWFKRTLFQPKFMCFKKNGVYYPLQVRAAPQPDDVKWENLEISLTSRNIRRGITAFLALVLMIISFAIIVMANSQKKILAGNTPDPTFCSVAIPGTIIGNYNFTKSHSTQAITFSRLGKESSGLDCVGIDPTIVSQYRSPGYPLGPCTSDCITLDTNATCSTITDQSMCLSSNHAVGCSSVSYSIMDKATACYCKTAITSLFFNHTFLDALQIAYHTELDLCKPFIENTALTFTLLFVSSAAVVIINTLLGILLKELAEFERHDSNASMRSAVLWKVFFAQFLNTSLLTLLVNASGIPGVFIPDALHQVFLFTGQYDDFTRGWFSDVGASMMTIALLNTIMPHVAPLLKYFLSPIQRCMCGWRKISQESMNEYYASPKFNFETRYAAFLNTIFCAYIYAPALPAMFPIAFVVFAVSYMIDKLLLLRFYQKPTSFDVQMQFQVLNSLHYAAFLYILVCCWIFGSDEVFYNSSISSKGTIADFFASQNSTEMQYQDILNVVKSYDPLGIVPRIIRINVFPLFVLVLLIIILVILWNVFGVVLFRVARTMLSYILCGRCGTARKIEIERVWNPQFTGTFKRPHDPTKPMELTPEETLQGWEIMSEPAAGGGTKEFRVKRATNDPNRKDKYLRTWEVMQEQYLATYDIMKNEAYKAALRAKFEPVVKDDNQIAKS